MDIFGFENFKHNNFEQLCINYVNEKLHKLYIAAIFEAEKVELTEEGLEDIIDKIQYPDLRVLEVIKLLDFDRKQLRYKDIKYPTEPKLGIFPLCDDLTVRKTKWELILEEIDKNHLANKVVYQKKSRNMYNFTIIHSAQNVEYDMREFGDRNVDYIPDGLENAMGGDTDPIV